MTRDGVLKGPPLPDLGRGIAGALCAGASTLAVYPLSLIVTRLRLRSVREGKQNDGKGQAATKEGGIMSVARQIYSNEGGLRAFYAGVLEATGKAFADAVLFFIVYGFIRRRLGARGSKGSSGLGIVEKILLGIVPEVFAKLCTAPIETIVSRKQASGKPTRVKELISQIVREKGIKGLWAGYSATLLLTINPLVAFTLDEMFINYLRKGSSQQAAPVLVPMLSKIVPISLTYHLSVAKTLMQAADNKFPIAKDKAASGEHLLLPSTLVDTLADVVRTGGMSGAYAGFAASLLHEFLNHGIAVLTKGAIYTWTVRIYYTYLLLSNQYHSLLDKAKKEIEDLAEATKHEVTHIAEETVEGGKKVIKASVEDIYADETADLVADYVEDEAEQWKSLYRWFWNKEKERHGER